MRLNIGASNVAGKYKHGWINLDLIKHQGIQVIGRGEKLPFAENSFDEIHCVHVLEHITREKQRPFLREMRRVIKPGQWVYIEVPDFIEVCKNLLQAWRNKDIETARIWTVSVYGKSERSGMAHHWGFNYLHLEDIIKQVGFNKLEWLTKKEDMISTHYSQEPVLLIRAKK